MANANTPAARTWLDILDAAWGPRSEVNWAEEIITSPGTIIIPIPTEETA